MISAQLGEVVGWSNGGGGECRIEVGQSVKGRGAKVPN